METYTKRKQLIQEANSMCLNEDQVKIVNETAEKLYEALKSVDMDFDRAINEGLFGKIVGGLAGFLAGPSIGKVVARALGIEKGVLYDMLTSRLVGTALGVAIADYMNSGNKD